MAVWGDERWLMLASGETSTVVGAVRAIRITVQTTSNAVQTIRLGVVNGNGDAISYFVHLWGIQDNGQRMSEWAEEGNGTRNSTANGKKAAYTLGPIGSTDTAAAPWTASAGVPTNWSAGAIAFSTNNLNLTFNADNSQTVNWRGWAFVVFHAGATP